MIIDKGETLTLKSTSGRNITVRLKVNPRAKRLILRIDQKNGEAVAVAPSKQKLARAAAFARSKSDWIIAQIERRPAAQMFACDAIIPVRGRPCRLSLDPHTGEGRVAKLIEGTPQILHLPGAPETLPARALRYLKKAARSDIAAAVDRHAQTLGVKPVRISIKDTRSRWGSCSERGNLSFSWRLILAEPFVLDYVAAHEVAHLLEMNHSAAFWRQVERTYPDWKPARRWLRTHGETLHAVG